MRELKADLHLLTALCDLGGVWDLDAVTGALTRFADATLHASLAQAVRLEVARGALTHVGEGPDGPAPGLFCIAMGKHGAFELNYSSDIDFSIFYAPEALPVAEGVEPQGVAVRIANHLGRLLQERTDDGYVFRIDLRLRPDPSSTPPAMPIDAALDYYESVGQNWERAAHIKARICAGDFARGEAFLAELQPFIWRKNLDFAAIADIHSIKRQIHAYKVDDRLTAKGADLKLGRGGIREIEFFVQTQQLILGGRHPDLRSPRTLEALAALSDAGHVTPEDRDYLIKAYRDLRALEHRAQMIADDQTHKLPESDADRKKVAALWGHGALRSFDAVVGQILKGVNRRYGALFKGEEELSSRFGSLVFTGVEDDPETLATLKRMGFSHPERVAATIRGWHHGHIAATRTERGRELFTRLAPRLLDAANATGAPDDAFNRFGDFFAGLSSGVQIQSLFLAQPRLFELIVEVMAFAPRLASTLARRPTALDALLDPAFFGPMEMPTGSAVGPGRLRGRDGRRAAAVPRPDLPDRRAGDQRHGRGPRRRRGLRRPGRRDRPGPGAGRPGRGRAAGRRVPGPGGRGGPGQGRLARDDRQVGPGPDDALRRRRPGGHVGHQGLERRQLLRPLHPAPDLGPVGADRRGHALRGGPEAAAVGHQGAGGGQLRGLRGLLRARGRDLGAAGPDPGAGDLGLVAGLPGPGGRARSPRPCAGRATRGRPPSTCWRCAS
jgi:glutamate-ammonia-ligase adenylyltransferase